MLIMRDTVAISLQEHRQVSIDISLSEIVRQFLKIQHSLRDFQAVVIDGTVRILSQAELLSKERNAIPECRHNLNRLVQDVVGHGVLWCRGIMNGFVKGDLHLPAPLTRTKNSEKYLVRCWSRRALAFSPQ